MPSDGVALAQLFLVGLWGLIAIWQVRRLETRVEAGFAWVEEKLAELDTAVKKLAGAVVPPPVTPKLYGTLLEASILSLSC